MAESRLDKLSARGQSVWVDYLSRDLVQSGELKRLMDENAVVGVTSNPTIFQKALSHTDAYDEQVEMLLEREEDPKEIFYHLAVRDVESALDLLAPAYERSPEDGSVSMEVDPNLAYDAKATCEEAKRLHEWIRRPNLYVKIPGTKPGLQAIEECLAAGRSINVTLLFSLERHKESMEAYLRGLERFIESGGEAAHVRSVASFFVSRVDTETDKRLEAIGSEEALALRGKLAIANARIAYQNYEKAFSGRRWEVLQAQGAMPQRCLWASTSTKNPEYRDVRYVEDMIGPRTVNTMPEETIEAFQDHGEVRGDTVLEGVDEAYRLFEQLAAVGIDYDDVVATLEREGVEKFSDSFAELLDEVRAKCEAVTA
jgi:transaldolase